MKFLSLVAGIPTLIATALAGGVSNAGKIPELDANGRLTADMLPSGLGSDSFQVTASEALAAGDFVNVYNNAGTAAVRKADASSAGKEANGYVLASVVSGGVATIFIDDLNDQVTGQTPGRVYLSVTQPGRTQTAAPTAASQLLQCVGWAGSATAIKVKIEQHYVLA